MVSAGSFDKMEMPCILECLEGFILHSPTSFCPCNRKLSASLYPCPEFPGGSFYLYMQHTETVEFNSSSATPIYLISV